MLSKNYSTLAILMAANVIDGGKKFEEVPASISVEVGELISPIEGKSFGSTLDSSKTNVNVNVPSSANAEKIGNEVAKQVEDSVRSNFDNTKEVAK